MDVVEIDELINVIDKCSFNNFSLDCIVCPLNKCDDCSKELHDRVIYALKRLRYLETPNNDEQPELPLVSESVWIPKTIEEFRFFIGTDENKDETIISVRAENALIRNEIKTIYEFVNIEKERYAILPNVGPIVFNHIAKKYDEARKILGLEIIETNVNKLELIFEGKRKWDYHERKLFSNTMNKLFS